MREAFGAFHLNVNFAATPDRRRIQLDIDHADLTDVEQVLNWQTHLRFLHIHPGVVLAVEDSKAMHAAHDRSRYFAMDELDEETRRSTLQMVSLLFADSTVREAGKGLTISGSDQELRQAEQVVRLAGKPQQDLQIKICIYTMVHQHESSLGIEPPSETKSFSLLSEARELISQNSSAASAIMSAAGLTSSDTLEIALLLLAAGYTTTTLENGFVYYGGGLTYMGVSFDAPSINASLTESHLKSIAETTLVTKNRQVATFHLGTKYPIKTGDVYSYTCSASSSSSTSSSCTSSSDWTQTVTPSVQYEDLGILLRIEPELIGDHDVFLNLDWKDQELAGSSINDVPVLKREEISNTVTLRLNSTALLVGYIGNTVTGGSDGVSSNSSGSREKNQVLVTITPELLPASQR